MSAVNRRSQQKNKNKNKRSRKSNTSLQKLPHYTPRLQRTTWSTPIMPTEIDIQFREIWTLTLSGANPVIYKTWHPNSLYQPEVGGGTAGIPGFTKYELLYNVYRVIRYSYHVTLVNNEAFGVVAFAMNNSSSFTPSTVRTATDPFSNKVILSAKGGQDRGIIKRNITLATLTGIGVNVETDPNFASGFTTSPPDTVQFTLAAQSLTGANLTNGVSYILEMHFFARLYEPISQV